MVVKFFFYCALIWGIVTTLTEKSPKYQQISDDEFGGSFSTFNSSLLRKRRSDPRDCYCALLINEVNTDSPFPSPSLFIELMRVYTTRRGPKPSNILADQFIIILRASPLAVVFYADLSQQHLHVKLESEVFVLGDPGLKELDDTGISLSNPAIRSIYKNKGQSRLLPDGNDSPYAILLLNGKDRRRDIIWMMLDQDAEGNYLERTFDPILINRFRPYISDMVVYGKSVHASTCTVFDNLWPDAFEQIPGQTYILRDWDVLRKPDYSLNRCVSNKLPFQVRSFMYDKPSPGQHNPCKGVHTFAESIIDKIAPLHAKNTPELEGCAGASPAIPQGRLANIDPEKFATVRESMMPEQSPFGDSGTTSQVDEAMQTAINNGQIVRLGGQPINTELIVTNKYDASMMTLAADYLPDSASIMLNTDIQKWLRVTKTESPEKPIKFTCAACLALYGDKLADVTAREAITTPEGYFNPDKYNNQKRIKTHALSLSHKDAVALAFKYANSKSENERKRLLKEYEERQRQDLIPTVAMIKSVWAEALAEVPFLFHPVIVDLQKSNGVNLGFHHYHKTAASQIAISIGETMHKTLLKYLVEKNEVFSLIVDATTSKRNIPYFISYFQLTQDGYPITFYFSVVDLAGGESALATFDSFWNKIIEDDVLVPGFLQYVKANLKVFVSDNAKVMTGSHKSFLQCLKNKLNTEIVDVGCMAHKLSLVLKWALRDKEEPRLKFVKTFEHNLNELYIFYMSRGSKRLQHLAAIALDMNIGIKRFRKNIEVRWAAGEYTVIQAIVHNKKAVRDDLLKIQTEDDFTIAAKTQAEQIFNILVDRPTNLLYHEFLDFLEINQFLSKKFQERAGLLVDHYDLILRAFEDYKNLADTPGPSLKKFINGCECPNTCAIGHCNLHQVEECKNARCDEGVSMQNTLDKDFRLYQVRPLIYLQLQQALEKYFNLDLIKALVVLDNRQFNNKLDPDMKIEYFKHVCNFLKLQDEPCKQIELYYFYLVGQLEANPTYSQNFNKKPSLFWPLVMQNIGNDLIIPVELLEFLKLFMILSDSSAEAERGFSILTRIDSHARSNLNPKTLDSLLRIKINGNKPVSKIDGFRYAAEYVRNHFKVDDPRGGKETSVDDSVYSDRTSSIF